MDKIYQTPMILEIYSEEMLLANQTDLVAEGWALWSNGTLPIKDLG